MRRQPSGVSPLQTPFQHCLLIWAVVQCLFAINVACFDTRRAIHLKKETEDLFYHGYESYMRHAFPEDELRPVSCRPLTRDPGNPARFEVNDALGNYSLTLIDSLSTLAILASSPSSSHDNKALRLFQDGIKDLVEQYGDGSAGVSGVGKRARGFDLDSKVQVFETVIRGLGGLLSAHLFAVGDLPITGYTPTHKQATHARIWLKSATTDNKEGINWTNGFVYDGQLLRLAYDLGQRLLPAFWTQTGIPYPRINLRTGIPFYKNSPSNQNLSDNQCTAQSSGRVEVTETCSAGAGSLVLEFAVLSRLTGDLRFEDLGKRAFWAIWQRRSDINLVGAGIDAETGEWLQPYSQIGAGIDSFFEYAFKSFILLSSEHYPTYTDQAYDVDPRTLFGPLLSEEHEPGSFLEAWEVARAAAERHLLRNINHQHPHYVVGDIHTGAARAFWIDALSAFYPGLLTLSGHVEEAVAAHLLTTALWTRFSALPERWNAVTGEIEGGLGWWVGRPEFIESNYYLYRATEDPWYQYVAEMTLRDIKRRCWARCGWSGLQDVVTGELSDRMESFFLGETAKYLFLTFAHDHPLNKLDSSFVFTTEGHPLIIPATAGSHFPSWRKAGRGTTNGTCPAKLPDLPFSISTTAARRDVYHAASLARLHLMPERDKVDSVLGEYTADHPTIVIADLVSPSNFTHFPWTLPPELIPFDAISARLPTRSAFEISFPSVANTGQSTAAPLQRVKDGILINFIGGLRLGLVQDVPLWMNNDISEAYRIHSINNVGIGKDEKVYLARDTGLSAINPTDPEFMRIRDTTYLDLVIEQKAMVNNIKILNESEPSFVMDPLPRGEVQVHSTVRAAWNSLMSQLTSLMQDGYPHTQATTTSAKTTEQVVERFLVPAIVPTGIGAAPIPDWVEAPSQAASNSYEIPLAWNTVYATGELCDEKLPSSVPQTTQVIIIKRGGCSFSQKLSNIPSIAPSTNALQLVIIVNYKMEDDALGDALLFRPLLDQVQKTRSGLQRQYPLPMVMVGGGAETYNALKGARSIGTKRRYSIRSHGVPVANLVIV